MPQTAWDGAGGYRSQAVSGGKPGKTELNTQLRGSLVRGTGEERVVCLRPRI